MLLVSGRVSVPKPLSQIQRSTRWLLQGLSPRTSFGGFGLNSSTVSKNTNSSRSGGGIYNSGTLILTNSTVIDNTTTNSTHPNIGGGGIFNGSILTLTNSTVSGNTASSRGGGIHSDGPLTVTNSTISGNRAEYGGGIYLRGRLSRTPVTLVNSSVIGNMAVVDADGIWNFRSRLTFANTIIASQLSRNDCTNHGTTISLGHNLDSDRTCRLSATGDLTNTDPLVGPLQDNGGPTFTHALLPGSPAIDVGDNPSCPASDQRGFARPVDGDSDGTATCDIGAFEFVPLVLTVNSADNVDDGACDAAHCSLREAINAVNANTG